MASSAPVPAGSLRDRLVASHMPLVRSIARRHVGEGEEFEDLVQVDTFGCSKPAAALIRAEAWRSPPLRRL